jgi:hypothetical protein
VLLLLRKSVRTKMTTPTDYPIGPLLGVSFPRFFVQIPGCEMASKKKWTVLQYYYIGYESRGGVDVIPWLPFSKTRFPRSKLKCLFWRFWEISCIWNPVLSA